MNIPGADGTQARHWTEAAAEGKQKDVMQVNASLSTSRIPLWRFDTVREETLNHQKHTGFTITILWWIYIEIWQEWTV